MDNADEAFKMLLSGERRAFVESGEPQLRSFDVQSDFTLAKSLLDKCKALLA